MARKKRTAASSVYLTSQQLHVNADTEARADDEPSANKVEARADDEPGAAKDQVEARADDITDYSWGHHRLWRTFFTQIAMQTGYQFYFLRPDCHANNPKLPCKQSFLMSNAHVVALSHYGRGEGGLKLNVTISKNSLDKLPNPYIRTIPGWVLCSNSKTWAQADGGTKTRLPQSTQPCSMLKFACRRTHGWNSSPSNCEGHPCTHNCKPWPIQGHSLFPFWQAAVRKDPIANIQKAKWCHQALAPLWNKWKWQATEDISIGMVFPRSVVDGIIACR